MKYDITITHVVAALIAAFAWRLGVQELAIYLITFCMLELGYESFMRGG